MDEVIANPIEAAIEAGRLVEYQRLANEALKEQERQQKRQRQKEEAQEAFLIKCQQMLPIYMLAYITEVHEEYNNLHIQLPECVKIVFRPDKGLMVTEYSTNRFFPVEDAHVAAYCARKEYKRREAVRKEQEEQERIRAEQEEQWRTEYKQNEAEREAREEEQAKVRQAIEAARQNYILMTDNLLDFARDSANQRHKLTEQESLSSIAASLAVIATKMMENNREYSD